MTRPRAFLAASACAALAVLLQACPPRNLRQISPPQMPGDYAAVVRTLVARDAAVTSLRARVRVKVQPADGKAVSTTVLITLRRPGALRVETLGPLDEVEGVFLLRDGRFWALSMREKKVKTGPADEGALEDALGLQLPPETLEAALCGSVRLVEFTQAQKGTDEPAKEIVMLVEKPGAAKQILRVDRDSLAIKKIEAFDGAGAKLYTMEFEETSPVAGVTFPHRIKAAFTGRVASVDVRFREIELNPAPGDGEFELEIPAGFTVE